jgi:hypothetical protein
MVPESDVRARHELSRHNGLSSAGGELCQGQSDWLHGQDVVYPTKYCL